MTERWIKIYDSLCDWEWYTDSYVKSLFIHLLIIANYKDLRFKGHAIKRGQCVRSVRHLAEDLGISINTVRRCLNCLKSTGEITVDNHQGFTIITVCNYENYQGVSPTVSRGVSPTVSSNDTHSDTEYRKEEYRNNKYKESDLCQQIADLYNEVCTSFPRLRVLSNARKKAIKARLRIYTIDDFRELFERAENSNFLKGNNERNWSATFDWLIKDSNMAKVLDGNYNDNDYMPKSEEEPAEEIDPTQLQLLLQKAKDGF